jgi:hypothetical protein
MTTPIAENERYHEIDLPFYRRELAFLPPQVLDFHAHTWRASDWKINPWESRAAGANYMVTSPDYQLETLREDGRRMFPDQVYNAVCFGNPTPSADLDRTNAYTLEASLRPGLFPLLVAGRGTLPADRLRQKIEQENWLGYKVFLNWYGDNYAAVDIPTMLGPEEMELANEHHLVVLLHVPRSGRLNDPVVKEGVRTYARAYPHAQIVLAHCGRCYLPDEMKGAIASIADLPNVYMDTSMVMDPQVLEMVFRTIGPKRVLFATDFPVAAMRGRRVYLMDHWVDVVLPGYPPSAFRVPSDDMRATFMAWEIALAVRRGAEMAGLDETELKALFFQNGMDVLNRVRKGQPVKALQAGWKTAPKFE